MGFWIWYIKKEIFWFLFGCLIISVGVSIILSLIVNPWFFIYPSIIILICFTILIVNWVMEHILEPIKEIIKSEKEMYNLEKTIKK